MDRLSSDHNLSADFTKIDDFVMKKTNKSKQFRPFLSVQNPTPCITKLLTTKNRYKWCNIKEIDRQRESNFHKTWTLNFLSIEVKNFMVLFLNNQLKYNAAISHFDGDIDNSCTFCKLYNIRPAEKETVRHIFLSCPAVIEFATEYFGWFLSKTNFSFENNWLLLGAPSDLSESLVKVINCEIAWFMFFVHKTKLRKKTLIKSNLREFLSFNRKLAQKFTAYTKALNHMSIPFDNG